VSFNLQLTSFNASNHCTVSRSILRNSLRWHLWQINHKGRNRRIKLLKIRILTDRRKVLSGEIVEKSIRKPSSWSSWEAIWRFLWTTEHSICSNRPAIHFFFSTLSAALVVLPAVRSFGRTDLMTPTATVCLMSRTANRPSGGKSVKPKDLNAGKTTKAADKVLKKKWMAGGLEHFQSSVVHRNLQITSQLLADYDFLIIFLTSICPDYTFLLRSVNILILNNLILLFLPLWLICHKCHRKEFRRIDRLTVSYVWCIKDITTAKLKNFLDLFKCIWVLCHCFGSLNNLIKGLWI